MRLVPAPTRPDDAGSDEEVAARTAVIFLAVEVVVVRYGVIFRVLNGTTRFFS